MTRALGVDASVDVDLYTIDVEAGDRVVLCSDGLTTMVRERDIERLARTEPDPQRLADALVAAANAAGGEDNTTVVVVDVLEVDAAGRTITPHSSPSRRPVSRPPRSSRRPIPRNRRHRRRRGNGAPGGARSGARSSSCYRCC